MRSFLNILDMETGHEIRLAEFGFAASLPSFTEDGIVFRRDGRWWKICTDRGMIAPWDGEIPTAAHDLTLRFTSELSDGIGYCELVRCGQVLVRFMGSPDSIGSAPISPDGKKLVFFGYPNKEFG
ncbi:MAG: hypothetical protein E7632_11375 [Ruminococcaceae bacterium]|nr:hypothetical protein [Oscillospiraceae bacterium]